MTSVVRPKRNTWSKDEDRLLKETIESIGEDNLARQWCNIAMKIPNKSAASCYQRWNRVIHPSLRKGAFTVDEYCALAIGILAYGEQWSKVAKFLPRRTDINCRSKWLNILKWKHKYVLFQIIHNIVEYGRKVNREQALELLQNGCFVHSVPREDEGIHSKDTEWKSNEENSDDDDIWEEEGNDDDIWEKEGNDDESDDIWEKDGNDETRVRKNDEELLPVLVSKAGVLELMNLGYGPRRLDSGRNSAYAQFPVRFEVMSPIMPTQSPDSKEMNNVKLERHTSCSNYEESQETNDNPYNYTEQGEQPKSSVEWGYLFENSSEDSNGSKKRNEMKEDNKGIKQQEIGDQNQKEMYNFTEAGQVQFEMSLTYECSSLQSCDDMNIDMEEEIGMSFSCLPPQHVSGFNGLSSTDLFPNITNDEV